MNKGKIIVAGIGPGSEADITPAVLAAIQSSDVIIGYKYYFRFITHLLREGTECIDTGMKREQARAEQAFAYANEEYYKTNRQIKANCPFIRLI